MPNKPPPGGGCGSWFDEIRIIIDSARKWINRFRYPHAVYFGIMSDEWNMWYTERYDWITENISDYNSKVWLDIVVFTVDHGKFKWIKGSFRFKNKSDLILYKMRWL